MTSGGYYYLHQDIPLYDISYPPPLASHVNTIITGSHLPPSPEYQPLFTHNSFYVYKSPEPCTQDPQFSFTRQIPDTEFIPTYQSN
jgi:hypothetical protein